MDWNHPVLRWVRKRGLSLGGVNSGDWNQEAFIRSTIKDAKNRIDLATPLRETLFVVVDLETTGFDPAGGDEIIAIGAVKVKNGSMQDANRFHTLVHPGCEIPSRITRLTGISDVDVQDAPSIRTALESWLRFVGNGTLVAYGAHHDQAFIQSAMMRCWGTRLNHRMIDAWRVAQCLHPEWQEHTLDYALAMYDIPIQGRHTADGDAWMTARLWEGFIQRCSELNLKMLEDLYARIAAI
ncbi:exonuclease domain-containing protein [Marinithermofilum abyssi]|nr:exonuclease domain-containing protein [Marinithermofilum abyssi]